MISSKNLGTAALDLLNQTPEPIHVLDLEMETEKKFFSEIEDIIAKHQEYAPKYYIQILMLQENFHKRYLPNVFSRKFVIRKTAPSPDYDTTLYSYDNRQDQLYFHWSIPSAESCLYLYDHLAELDKTDREFYDHIQKFASNKITSLINHH